MTRRVARAEQRHPEADFFFFRMQFIVMFRARFTEAFPKSSPNFGPQELERDVVEPIPGERVEHFLCALLGLLLNRKQDVKYVALSCRGPQCTSPRLSFTNLLTSGFTQTRSLQPCSRGGYSDTQGAMGKGLGEPESTLRASNLCLHDTSATGMVSS